MLATLSELPARPVSFLPSYRSASGMPAIPLNTTCTSCHLRELCLPCGLAGCDVELLDNLMFLRRKVKEGRELYREGEKFQFIYAVRSGTFKSGMSLADGREQVSGFYLAGELMGLDGAAHGAHSSNLIALEDSEVCAIPYGRLTEVAADNVSMQHIVSRLMSREIVREHSLMMLLGSMNAEERLAAFLLNLSQRLKARGFSATQFHLRMSRAEIGSYLGLKLETVSRTFSAFQQRRVLDVDKRHIRIIDMNALARSIETHAR
jgi:CRP/FNR family transcriptional regulator